jgi:MYXO-CTERM domain-containing protein
MMLKKIQIVLMAFMLTTVLGTQVFAENIDGYGNVNNTQTHATNYQGTNTTNYRTTATDGTYRGSNWGWLGLLGLIGLAGLRGRNENREPNRK